MRNLNNKNRIDRAVGAVENASKRSGKDEQFIEKDALASALCAGRHPAANRTRRPRACRSGWRSIDNGADSHRFNRPATFVENSLALNGGYYIVGPVYVFGLGPVNDIYNYPQWTVTSLWVDDPNSDLDLTALRAKIASINSTFVSDLSSAMESYMNSIDSITTKCATNTRKCWTKNSSLVFPGCANPNLLIWSAELDSAIDAFESAVGTAITTANDAMESWINYIN